MLHFTQHADKQYEQALNTLRATLQEMSEKAGQMIGIARNALESAPQDSERHLVAAKQLDKEINTLERAVEEQVTALLTRHTMLVDELRFVLCAIRIAAALERVGDMAKNTAKRIHKLTLPLTDALRDEYIAMLKSTSEMIVTSLGLLERYDENTALAVCRSDDEVDSHYKNIIISAQTLYPGEKLAPVLFLAKNLERMADYASGVAKEVAYIQTGKKLVLN